MISRIDIEGYKSIKKLSIDLKSINILLGGNGVGKSNFISLFTLLRNIYNQNFQNYIQRKGGANSFLYFGRKVTQEIVLKVFFSNGSESENLYKVILQVGQSSLFIKYVGTAYNSFGTWHSKKYENDVLESNFANIYYGQAFYVNDRLKEFDVYHFHDTGDLSPMKASSDVNDNRRLKSDGSNIASILYLLKSTQYKVFKRIELTIKSIAPFLDRFVLEPDLIDDTRVSLEWREKGYPETYFDAHDLSDGTLRFICLATLLMQPNPPKTIIIDEPELGLHPVAINKLAALIRKASEKTQIILSTQSMNLIDNFNPEDIIVADRSNEGSVLKRLNSEDLAGWLEEYTLGDLWGKNQIGAQPYSI